MLALAVRACLLVLRWSYCDGGGDGEDSGGNDDADDDKYDI